MKAIEVIGEGKEARLELGEAPTPKPEARELRIAVTASAVNRADLLQRRGLYPPPPGASSVLGLECAGVVEEVGSEVRRYPLGARVMALLAGGGYAEQVVVHEGSVLPIPDGMSFEEAAAVPETFLTCYLNLFRIGAVREGQWVLVHGGGSGIGTSAIRLLRAAGVHVIVTCGSLEKVERCRELGADAALNYREGPFAPEVLELTRGEGVDLVLDSIGAPYLEPHLRCLRVGGSLILIGLMGGAKAEINLGMLLARRLSLIGSTLRARSVDEKAAIVHGFLERFGEALRSGTLQPVVDRVLSLASAQEAHDVVERSEHFGKVVLRVRD
ncbi:MAG: NAD(P)H-quinone oxidoreductase [Myxococcales bacterium]|nr:NAD(P)H-quinone oxidoreductase [Myxococcales bacterium]TDI94912.1 MAG: NAD(P)H-quinone oxidoreductase [Deltaproteobacteria bacterium]TDJ05119.1 MAG: NAD(P)H-quinone oxidoreductase [Deltaproteobacteria bacterium]